MEALSNLQQLHTVDGNNNSLFGGATPHSPGEVATAGARVRETPKRLTNELTYIFEQAIKCIKKYECSRDSSKGCS